jgi:hypothetical protein
MLASGQEKRSQLTSYFDYNMSRRNNGQFPLRLKYNTAYRKLRYDVINRKWQEYKIGTHAEEKLCRLQTVSPKDIQLLVSYSICLKD